MEVAKQLVLKQLITKDNELRNGRKHQKHRNLKYSEQLLQICPRENMQ